jgi:hypothetical protein
MDAVTAHKFLLPAASNLFPAYLHTPEAMAMLLAIGMQESDFIHRQQLIGHHRNWWESVKGPARSFWQFELIGIQGVLEHPATRSMAITLCQRFGYPIDAGVLHRAVTHNDLLAAGFARLALYRLPYPLPARDQDENGWNQYIEAWRPGKPKPDRWPERFKRAWEIVNASAH